LAGERLPIELLIGRGWRAPGGAELHRTATTWNRALLAEHAHAELAAIAGLDLGKDMAAWSEWLEANGDALAPAPWTSPTEPVAAWQERILTATPL
jgi:hypothetical protein